MPEMPEVEHLQREMETQLVGRVIAEAEGASQGRPGLNGAEWLPTLKGARLLGVTRRGKYNILEFDNGLCVVIHLMLLGQARLFKVGEKLPYRFSLRLTFEEGDSLLVTTVSPRSEHVVPKADLSRLIEKLGPDVQDPDLTLERFRQLVRQKGKGLIKPLLMEQSFIAGVGNTYANETLFLAGVRPDREVQSLTDAEIDAVYDNLRPVLQRAFEHGGSSAENYVHLNGEPGHYQEHFIVHRQEGKPCPNGCGGPIVRKEINGRGSFFCPNCQK